MSDLVINRLNMIGTCLQVAQSPAHQPVWQNQPPLDFGTDLAALGTAYTAATDLAAQLGSAAGGSADDKAVAETAIEDRAYQLARALVSHFKKTGNLTDRSKVDLSRTDIQRLRDQNLVTTATVIRDLAQGALAQPGAAGRGVTAARVTALTAAIAGFTPFVNAARTQIVNRAVVRRELETQVAALAALVAAVTDLDDLVVQFDSADGLLFQEAWKAARNIIDAGHSPSEPTPPPPPTP
jgi:hypothetical protein